jgi:murein L,D-transpeptidase YafK
MKQLAIAFALLVALAAPALAQGESRRSPRKEVSITILKRARQLWLYRDHQPVKVYRVFLGSSPTGDKTERGDNRTPEGDYRIVEKRQDSKFHRFITIDYPNLDDANRAYEEGRLTANAKGIKPPWDTPLGGFLGIHGIGDNEKFKLRLIDDWDWTNGCVALKNRDVEELFRLVPVGTAVRIRK